MGARINLRGAYVHMVADAGISAGVVLGGIGIIITGWSRIDPIVSLMTAAFIPLGTWRVLRDSLDLALDAVPAGVRPEKVLDYLKGLPGVAAVCDLHIWALTDTTETAMTVHLG